jgi:methyl-accepting chemotaxis protein
LRNPQKTSLIIVYFLELKSRFSGMKYQWMAGLCLLAVIPLLILVYVTVTTSRYGIEAKLPETIKNSLTSLGDSLDLVMAGVENQMTAIAGSASFRNDLSKLESAPAASAENQSLKSSLSDWLNARDQKGPLIARIMILGGEETSVNCAFDQKKSYQKVAGSKWYSQVPAENGKFLWIGSHPQLDAQARVNYSMSCLMRLTGRYILIMDVATPPVSNILSQKLIPGGGGTYLIDPERRTVAETTVKGHREAAQAAKRRTILAKFLKSNTNININIPAKGEPRPVVKSLAEITSTKIAYYPLTRAGWVLVSVISGPEYQTTTKSLVWILILSGFILAAALIGAGLFFTNRITNRLVQVINAFRQAESGNLNTPLAIRSRDEIGAAAAGYHAINKNFIPFLTGIRDLTERQNNVADIMTAAFKEVAVTITDVLNTVRAVAGSAAKQSDETAGLSGFINELAEKVDSITANIKSIREIGLNTQELTTTGISSVETLNQNVSKTNVITLSISDHLNVLNEETIQITEMISSIHEIADRNNILALNSLISAAKAGESGRGFSVVANNVKKLAERSMIVTREISDFISGLQKRMVATAEAASSIGATVEAQNQAFKESIQVFNRINTVTNHLIGRLAEIIKLVDDMEANKTQTLNSMNSISFRTRQIAAMMSEIQISLEQQLTNIADLLALAKELKKVSHRLQQTIKDFKIV